jgi:hypothetical protein
LDFQALQSFNDQGSIILAHILPGLPFSGYPVFPQSCSIFSGGEKTFPLLGFSILQGFDQFLRRRSLSQTTRAQETTIDNPLERFVLFSASGKKSSM